MRRHGFRTIKQLITERQESYQPRPRYTLTGRESQVYQWMLKQKKSVTKSEIMKALSLTYSHCNHILDGLMGKGCVDKRQAAGAANAFCHFRALVVPGINARPSATKRKPGNCTPTQREEQVLEFLRQHGPATKARVGEFLGIATNHAGTHLRSLVAKGLVQEDTPEQTGRRPANVYRVVGD